MNSGENNNKKQYDFGDNNGKDMYNFNQDTGMMGNEGISASNNPNPTGEQIEMPSGVSFEENGSFCRLSSDGGILEIDLRSNKQRGVENRFLSISVTGLNDNNEFGKAEMFLLSEAQLKALKSFVEKLNWND